MKNYHNIKPEIWVADEELTGSDELNSDHKKPIEVLIKETIITLNVANYKQEAAKVIACKICGNIEFQVGISQVYTAIKCPKCKWEVCIHEG